MRKIASLALAAAVAGGLTIAGSGAAYAAPIACLGTTGATVCWDAGTHALTVTDTLADGDYACAHVWNVILSRPDLFCTTGGLGTSISVDLTNDAADYDLGNQITVQAQRYSAAHVLLNSSGVYSLTW
jgi:hypothetical protein